MPPFFSSRRTTNRLFREFCRPSDSRKTLSGPTPISIHSIEIAELELSALLLERSPDSSLCKVCFSRKSFILNCSKHSSRSSPVIGGLVEEKIDGWLLLLTSSSGSLALSTSKLLLLSLETESESDSADFEPAALQMSSFLINFNSSSLLSTNVTKGLCTGLIEENGLFLGDFGEGIIMEEKFCFDFSAESSSIRNIFAAFKNGFTFANAAKPPTKVKHT